MTDLQKNINKNNSNLWETQFDRGINKILIKEKLPATVSLLIVFAKDFIHQLLKTNAKKSTSMRKEIKNDKLIIEIPLNRNEFWLHYKPLLDEWSINYKIDRSYKGKDPDLGMPIVYLDDDDLIEELKKWLDVIEFN